VLSILLPATSGGTVHVTTSGITATICKTNVLCCENTAICKV
jgi:hypothetical protein